MQEELRRAQERIAALEVQIERLKREKESYRRREDDAVLDLRSYMAAYRHALEKTVQTADAVMQLIDEALSKPGSSHLRRALLQDIHLRLADLVALRALLTEIQMREEIKPPQSR